jgi:glutathione S-transferase
MSDNKPILGYWKIRGLAEGIRYQLAYSKVDYKEDVYEQGDGPEFSRASWMDVKFQQGLDFPNLPYLKDGGFSITESGAIHRYCAKKWCPELLHLDDAEMYAKSEMLWGVVADAKMFVTMQCYIGDGCKETLASKALDRLELLAKTVKDNEYVAGDKLSCADFAFVEFVEMVEFISDGKVFETYPSLKQYRDGIFELPGLRDYIETRGHLSFNNKVAKINN